MNRLATPQSQAAALRGAAAMPPGSPAESGAADSLWRDLLHSARAPYRTAGRFAWHFAHGKLARDPVFRSLLECGAIAPQARIVDIGCGQGLLASLLAAVEVHSGRWPSCWAPPPVATRYLGIELMPRDVARAEAALRDLPGRPAFLCADMVEVALPACDVAVILDVLHYVDHAAQQRVLERILAALEPGGRLLLRVGDQSERRGFAASQWTDRIITAVRGHRVAPTFGRPLADWLLLLGQLGFTDLHSLPMSRGTPFANVLLIGRKG